MNHSNFNSGSEQADFEEEWLSAYLDGELEPSQVAIVEQRLQLDSNAQQLFLDLQRVRDLVSDLPKWSPKTNQESSSTEVPATDVDAPAFAGRQVNERESESEGHSGDQQQETTVVAAAGPPASDTEPLSSKPNAVPVQVEHNHYRTRSKRSTWSTWSGPATVAASLVGVLGICYGLIRMGPLASVELANRERTSEVQELDDTAELPMSPADRNDESAASESAGQFRGRPAADTLIEEPAAAMATGAPSPAEIAAKEQVVAAESELANRKALSIPAEVANANPKEEEATSVPELPEIAPESLLAMNDQAEVDIESPDPLFGPQAAGEGLSFQQPRSIPTDMQGNTEKASEGMPRMEAASPNAAPRENTPRDVTESNRAKVAQPAVAAQATPQSTTLQPIAPQPEDPQTTADSRIAESSAAEKAALAMDDKQTAQTAESAKASEPLSVDASAASEDLAEANGASSGMRAQRLRRSLQSPTQSPLPQSPLPQSPLPQRNRIRQSDLLIAVSEQWGDVEPAINALSRFAKAPGDQQPSVPLTILTIPKSTTAANVFAKLLESLKGLSQADLTLETRFRPFLADPKDSDRPRSAIVVLATYGQAVDILRRAHVGSSSPGALWFGGTPESDSQRVVIVFNPAKD